MYFSQLAADQQSPVRFLGYHGAVEAALTNSTVDWTFVRPNLILQAYLRFAPIVAEGALCVPTAMRRSASWTPGRSLRPPRLR